MTLMTSSTMLEFDKLVAKMKEQVANVEGTDANLIDSLTMNDLDKAFRQFAANIDRAIADASRRLENNQMFY